MKGWKAVNAAVRDKQAAYAKASAIKDELQIAYEDIVYGRVSPVVKRSALAATRKELDAAGRLLDSIELDLRGAVVPIGMKEAIPSLTTLERRLSFIKSKPGMAKNPKLKNVDIAIASYKDVIRKMATNKKVIEDANKELADAYKAVDDIVNELKPALKAQADVWGKPAAFKKRYYAQEQQTRVVNGELVSIDSFVTGTNNFSAAMRSEISNARTSDLNLIG